MMGLRDKSLKYQITNFVASILIGLFVVMSVNGIMFGHQVGIFWGVFSMVGVAVNDLFAYFSGRTFGRTPLITLSPNKTLEGFVGAAIWTVIFLALNLGFFFGKPNLICEVQSITFNPFSPPDCQPYLNPAYTTEVQLNFLGLYTWHTCPAAISAVLFCLFTSLIGPFAGFFASGFKRGYKIKDFANTLPGHGGFFDRFDCILLMGIVVRCFLSSNFLMRDSLDVEEAMGIV